MTTTQITAAATDLAACTREAFLMLHLTTGDAVVARYDAQTGPDVDDLLDAGYVRVPGVHAGMAADAIVAEASASVRRWIPAV